MLVRCGGIRPVLEALNQKFHKECFTCTQCNTGFSDNKFLKLAGDPYCSQSCIDARK